MKFLTLLIWRAVIYPVLCVLALPLLLIAMVVLGVVVFIMQTWVDAHNA